MDLLIDLGIDESDLKNILDQCNDIMNLSFEEIKEKIDILSYVGCSVRQIRNIIICNPYYLDRFSDDVLKLISYLKRVGFSNLNFIFDSNPFFLNKDDFEIKDYIDSRLRDNVLLEDIVNDIENNPYIIDEV